MPFQLCVDFAIFPDDTVLGQPSTLRQWISGMSQAATPPRS